MVVPPRNRLRRELTDSSTDRRVEPTGERTLKLFGWLGKDIFPGEGAVVRRADSGLPGRLRARKLELGGLLLHLRQNSKKSSGLWNCDAITPNKTFEDQIGFVWGLMVQTGGGSPSSKPSRSRLYQAGKVVIYRVKVGLSHFHFLLLLLHPALPPQH